MLWVDYDNNGSLDLFVSYDLGDLRLYKNDGNFNFTDETVSSGLFPTVGNPSGFSFADTDHDNDLDLYFVVMIQLHQKINITKIKETEHL